MTKTRTSAKFPAITLTITEKQKATRKSPITYYELRFEKKKDEYVTMHVVLASFADRVVVTDTWGETAFNGEETRHLCEVANAYFKKYTGKEPKRIAWSD